MAGALILRDPVVRCTVLGRQHPFAGLQADAVAAFETFENTFGFLLPLGDDLGKLFEQRFGHERTVQNYMNI